MSHLKTDGRLQALADWTVEHKSLVDTMYKDYPEEWKQAYRKAYETMEKES